MKQQIPQYPLVNFTCPHCGAFSKHSWTGAIRGDVRTQLPNGNIADVPMIVKNIILAKGDCCNEVSVWKNEKMIYPIVNMAPLPNDDMPENIKTDYLEAAEIVSMSPKGAAALLRLCVQNLCKFLGEKGDNINEDIESLIKKGLSPTIQKALDSVRVVGNNAVHPSTIDFNDGSDVAIKLFGIVNFICEKMITDPRKIESFYLENVPEKIQSKRKDQHKN